MLKLPPTTQRMVQSYASFCFSFFIHPSFVVVNTTEDSLKIDPAGTLKILLPSFTIYSVISHFILLYVQYELVHHPITLRRRPTNQQSIRYNHTQNKTKQNRARTRTQCRRRRCPFHYVYCVGKAFCVRVMGFHFIWFVFVRSKVNYFLLWQHNK